VWFTKPVTAHRNCSHEKCNGHVTLWYKGADVLRVTARKDEYGEVKEWICNECRFDKKETADWTIEGPAQIERSSVISANHYELPVINPQVISDMPESVVRDLEQNPPLKLGGFNG
jgi:NADH-quinone oxidoreductase subunit G